MLRLLRAVVLLSSVVACSCGIEQSSVPSDLPPPSDGSWVALAPAGSFELRARIRKPSLLRAPESEAERVPVVYAISEPGEPPAKALVYGWTGKRWQSLPPWGEWQPRVHVALAVVPRNDALWFAAASSSSGDVEPFRHREKFGPGEAPPGLFGESLEDCRVKLQCRRAGASDNSSSDFGPGMLTDNFHCGWFTRIPDAQPLRLGTDIVGEFKLLPAHGGALDWDSELRAVEFASDEGYRQHDSRYMFLPFDAEEPHDLNLVGGARWKESVRSRGNCGARRGTTTG